MIRYSEVSRIFRRYVQRLLIHQQNEPLSDLYSGATYRLRCINTGVLKMDKIRLTSWSAPYHENTYKYSVESAETIILAFL